MLSVSEIKADAEKLAIELGYNPIGLSLDVINVKDAYCIGYTKGEKSKEEYAKEVTIDFNKFKIDNGWIESASRHHFYQPNEETDFLTIEQLFDLYKQSNP